ncbi:MAG: hypothetical protein IJ333_05095, partial [Clostridia bacterium]|nr:hypothetical protein [Clostridia bacterium]
MKKKRIMLMLGIGVLVATVGLVLHHVFAWKEQPIKLDPDYHELFTKEYLSERGHEEELAEYATDVSIAYQNADGTKSLYVYASPIRFLNSTGQYSIIDTRLANVRDTAMREAGYIYTIANSDIKSFYPKEANESSGVLIQKDIQYEIGFDEETPKRGWYREMDNFISESKKAVQYKDCFGADAVVSFYPSSLGVNCEIDFPRTLQGNIFSLWMEVNGEGVSVRENEGGYITIDQKSIDGEGNRTYEIKGVIQKPLLKTADGTIYYDSTMEVISEGNGRYLLVFQLNEAVKLKNAKAFISFEMRREKQPDNALYSKLPEFKEAYLRNYSVIGNSEDYGIGRLMVRYKFAKFFNLRSMQVLNAKYSVYSLNEGTTGFELKTVLEDWCSITGNWTDEYKTGDVTSTATLEGHQLTFDITEEVEKWCDDAD